MKNITSEFEHDICFWDNTHIIASKPIRTPRETYPAKTLLDPNDYYVLNDNLKVRKEKFGCIVQNQDAFTIKCFDEQAFEFFNHVQTPLKGSELLKACNDHDFIVDRLKDLTLRKEISNSTAKFYDYSDPITPLSAPIAVEIEITRKCLRKCDYCAYGSSPHASTEGELSANKWKQILKDASDIGVASIEFTGGDPLTRRDGLEILEYADSLGFLYTINSDLSHLPDRDLARIRDLNNLVAIQTTIDGSTKELHDKYRGKGGYVKTVAGAQKLFSENIPVGVGMIISKSNYKDVPNVVDLCMKLGVSYFFVGSLYVAGRANSMTEDVPNDIELGVASRAYAKAVFDKKLKPAHPSFYRHEKRYKADPEHFNHLENQTNVSCSGMDTLRFDPTGKCYVGIKLEKFPELFYMGDLSNNSIIDIWRYSKNLGLLRKLYEQNGVENFHGIDIRDVPSILGHT